MKKNRSRLWLFPLLLLAACTFRQERGVRYTLVPREGAVPSPELSAELARNFTAQTAQGGLGANSDGSASVLDFEGRERLRFYAFPQEGEDAAPGGWIALSPKGFYTASLASNFIYGASFITVDNGTKKFSLSQFSESLFRPDLIDALLQGRDAGEGLDSLLRQENLPPELAFSEPPVAIIQRDGTPEGILNMTVTDSGGGIGTVAVFSGSLGRHRLLALYDSETIQSRKYREKNRDRIDVEIRIPLESGTKAVGVSVFNRARTAESERRFIELPEPVGGTAPASGTVPGIEIEEAATIPGEKPALEVLVAAPGLAFTGERFARQEQGSLYSKVRVSSPESALDGESGAGNMPGLFGSLKAELNRDDVFVLCLPGPAGLDGRGDWRFSFPGEAGRAEGAFGKWELLENMLKLRNRRTILIFSGGRQFSGPEKEAGFTRLRAWLGEQAFLAVLPEPELLSGVLENLPPGPEQYLSAREFIGLIEGAAGTAGFGTAGGVLSSVPAWDFPFLDRWPGFGEIRMQTMASGSVIIDDFDNASQALTFGETLVRKVPAGQYRVSMSYRNGRRETKEVDVRSMGSSWVTFNYVPDLLAGDLKGAVPLFGVSIAELNPANYRNPDPEVLRVMAPGWQLAFLSGEDLYKKGNYDQAISEYTRAIGLKSDYTGAYVSRGNAYRKKGDLSSAIDDYTRALKQKADYAEVYNYRGYLYSQQKRFNLAIADYTQAIKYRSGYADAFFNRACAYIELRDWDKAIADYTQVIRLEPSNATAYNERGNAWHYKEDYDKAIADYTQALKFRPGYALAYRSRGSAWYSKGDPEKAEADYRAAGP
ncbi:MAG: tetratricopeptide repeat protein [Treponema sp.]|jgi:tetratricopeptide (TPR) repeat protein|nr:tetratricopeptide repeat protein [Treponema sp.]